MFCSEQNADTATLIPLIYNLSDMFLQRNKVRLKSNLFSPNKPSARAQICNYEGSETKLRGLENKFLSARNKKYEGSEWLLRALGMFLMVLCASFFSGIMAVLNPVRQDDDIRTRDKRMADGGIRKKATQRGNDSYRRVAL